MKKTRVCLSTRPRMLSEVMRTLIEHQEDMGVVAEAIGPMELLRVVKTGRVDVVIVSPVEVNDDVTVSAHLLSAHPGLKVVTISAAGAANLHQSGYPRLQIDNPNGQSILDTIREAPGSDGDPHGLPS